MLNKDKFNLKNTKKYLPKVLSGVLSLTILCSMVGVASYSAGAESTEEKNSASATSKSDTSAKNSDTKKLSKDETVYVIADANGEAKKVIVSDWIKNGTNSDKVTDKSNLSDVDTVKGDATYTMNEDETYEWTANGDDIYYQGTGTTELPVGVSITYKLDGKEISAENLAGKSGKVTMRFDYSNRQYDTVKIDGKDEKIYVPFVMMTGMMLDNSNFSNVEVTNGKVLNDGSHTYVAGFALPGVQESLGIDSKDFEIPNYVEITADTTDFELTTTLTLATNEMFSDIDFSKVDDKMDELNDKLDKLTDATDRLLDGSSQLYSGLSTLLDKSGDLVDGIDQLYSGAEQLKDGASTLDTGAGSLLSGATTLDNGVGSLKSGANSLYSGASSLDSGAASLDNGASQISSGASSLDAGVSQLQSYISQLSGGLSQISDNSENLNAGAKQVFESLLATADKQIAAAGLTAETLTISNYATVLEQLIGQLSEENIYALAYQTALDTVTENVNSQSDVIRSAVENQVRKQVVEGVLASAGYSMTSDEYDSAVASGQISEEVQAQISAAVSSQMTAMQSTIDSNTQTQIQSLIEQNMQSEQVQSGINEAVAKGNAGREALSALKAQLDSYNTFYQGVLSYTAGVDQANSGAEQILNGTYSLKSGSSQLASGSADLKNGTSDLKSGTSQLKNGSSTLKNGVSDLKDGSSSLKNGAGSLKSGTSTLKDGTVTLFNGISTMKSGSSTLIDGIRQLAEGSLTLNDGLKQYKEEGVDVIVDAVNGDVQTLVDRFKAMSDVSGKYKTYSGTTDDMDGKVDFIFKTDSISNDD